ncbi:hypothetical protein RRG08_062720 [Elysia crispata]|uniref:Uncharacterized protein n=1 Tax=Elysia crispata TaxID=231223 RepID=A0AAE1ACF1_9GAST|nr:hypothetical protein RRG08_062720 [Elysia crispata]
MLAGERVCWSDKSAMTGNVDWRMYYPKGSCQLKQDLSHHHQEKAHNQAKQSNLKKNEKQQNKEGQEEGENPQSIESRGTKRTSFTASDSENFPRDVRQPEVRGLSKDNSHHHLVQYQHPKQSYGSLEDFYTSGNRGRKGSDKGGSRRDSGFRYERCRDAAGRSPVSDTTCVESGNLAGDGRSAIGGDADDDDSDDKDVFFPCDSALRADNGAVSSGFTSTGVPSSKTRASCNSHRKTEARSAPSHAADNNENDDDVESEINENVALVSAKQWRDRPSPSSSSVSIKGGKNKADKNGAKNVEDVEKPQTSRKNFARLIGLYKRDINKSGKWSRQPGPTAETSAYPAAVRKSSAASSTQTKSPNSPRTPTIQITTPALSEDARRTSGPIPPPPVLKSALVKSSLSFGSATTTTTAATTPPKHPLPNTAKHKVSFITGLRRFSREKAAFLRVDHSEQKPKAVPTSAPTYLFPALPLADPNTGKSSSGGSQAGTGSRRGAGAGDRRKLKVEFAVMDSEVVVENSRGIRGRARWGVMGAAGARGSEFEDGGGGMFSLKDDVENDVAMLGGSRARFRQARLSLLGKPLNYKAHRRDMRYRRLQSRIYNFLERPKSWGSWLYHLAM